VSRLVALNATLWGPNKLGGSELAGLTEAPLGAPKLVECNPLTGAFSEAPVITIGVPKTDASAASAIFAQASEIAVADGGVYVTQACQPTAI